MIQLILSQGVLILFEGGEKVGKTTQIAHTKEYLETKGYPVLVSYEPGGGDPNIRAKLLDMKGTVTPEQELHLFCEDRALHVKNVLIPALQQKKVVLLDRFEPSTIAYQGYARGMSIDYIKKQSAHVRNNIWPDIIFLLDADPKTALAREEATSRFDAEKIDFHKKVREGFLAQTKEDPARWHIIDATQSREHVWQDIKKKVDILLEKFLGKQLDAIKAYVRHHSVKNNRA